MPVPVGDKRLPDVLSDTSRSTVPKDVLHSLRVPELRSDVRDGDDFKISAAQDPGRNKKLYAEWKQVQAETIALLGEDASGLRSNLDFLACPDGIENLVRKRSELRLAALRPATAEASRIALEKLEAEFSTFCGDRVQRQQTFNALIREGVIDLTALEALRTSGDVLLHKAAIKEIRALYSTDPELMRFRLPFPSRETVPLSGVVKYGVEIPPGEEITAGQLLRGDRNLRDLPTVIKAVQHSMTKLSGRFHSSEDFNNVITSSGVEHIVHQLETYSNARMTLSRTTDPTERKNLEKICAAAVVEIGVQAIDFMERSDAMCEVLDHAPTRAKLFRDLSNENRIAFKNHDTRRAYRGPAEKYHCGIRAVISILQSSPEQIESAVVVLPTPPYVARVEQPRPPTIPVLSKLAEPRNQSSAAAAAQTQPLPPAAIQPGDFSGLPPTSGPASFIRAQASERCAKAMKEVLKVVLGTRMYTPTADGQDPTLNMVKLAIRTNRVADNTTSEVGASIMFRKTNAIFDTIVDPGKIHYNLDGTVATPSRVLRELVDLRKEMQEKMDGFKRTDKDAGSYEKSLLAVRKEYESKASVLITKELPMIRPGDLNIAEALLSDKDIARLTSAFKPPVDSVPKVTLPAAETVARSGGRKVEMGTTLSPVTNAAPPGIPNKPPVVAEDVQPISATISQRIPPVFDTKSRQTIQPLRATETSMIHVNCIVNGEEINVCYDTIRRRYLSDPASAERSGVRFVDTGAKGPNGMPMVQVELTFSGNYKKIEYIGLNTRTAGVWSGSVPQRTGRDLNEQRLHEARAAGDDAWHSSLPTAATTPEGGKYSYAYSSQDRRLYAKSPDGKRVLGWDQATNTWHTLDSSALPNELRQSGAT